MTYIEKKKEANIQISKSMELLYNRNKRVTSHEDP